MTDAAQTLSYATPGQFVGTCPLCRKRPATAKAIYGHPVCKKCFYAFANRRQLGYLVDAVLITIINLGIVYGLQSTLGRARIDEAFRALTVFVVSAAITCLFLLKDGFNGGSIGKKLADIQVLDERTGQPIGFGQSFKRNSVLLFGLIPYAGALLSLAIIITIAIQVAKGYRIGDRFAQTRAIWKRYAQLPIFGGDALVCDQCGYDLHGNVSGICPECGKPISEQTRQQLAAATPGQVA
jgi:uncharacterized RDD family membrane protein YckC